MKKRQRTNEINTYLTPESMEEPLKNELDGNVREEFIALRSRLREICSNDDDPLISMIEDLSLSDEEREIVERYEELKNLAQERLNDDIFR